MKHYATEQIQEICELSANLHDIPVAKPICNTPKEYRITAGPRYVTIEPPMSGKQRRRARRKAERGK